MRHRSAVLCQTTIVDQRSQNISLINVIDQLTVEKGSQKHIPNEQQSKGVVVPFTADFVIHSERSSTDQSESCKGRILIKGPEQQKIDEINFEVDLSEHSRSRFVVQFSVFPFVGTGIYQLEVEYCDDDTDEWKPVDRVPLEVLVTEDVPQEKSTS